MLILIHVFGLHDLKENLFIRESLIRSALLIAQTEHLKAMDAIHVAIADHHSCDLFVSSDPHLRHLKIITPYWIDLTK